MLHGETESRAYSAAPWEALESGAAAWADLGSAAREATAAHYAPRVRFWATRLKAKLPHGIELDDLISAGTLGLVEAFGKFRPQLGTRFSTYAENRIRGAMLDELRRLDWFPRTLRQRMRRIDSVIRQAEGQGIVPTEEYISRETGIEKSQVRQCMEALQNQLWISLESIEEDLAHDGPPSPAAGPCEKASLKEYAEKLAPLVDRLTEREKLVLSLYYVEELNMHETAEVMGITEGRVSQLHAQALKRLKKEFQKEYENSGI